jgi:hypothetical protein
MNARGASTTLSDALQKGPVVLKFHRGAWCPIDSRDVRGLTESRGADVAFEYIGGKATSATLPQAVSMIRSKGKIALVEGHARTLSSKGKKRAHPSAPDSAGPMCLSTVNIPFIGAHPSAGYSYTCVDLISAARSA